MHTLIFFPPIRTCKLENTFFPEASNEKLFHFQIKTEHSVAGYSTSNHILTFTSLAIIYTHFIIFLIPYSNHSH